MITESWQLETSMDAVIFDCDGTLSTIEGIDEIAKENGVKDEVESLTSLAMGTTGIYPDLYKERLDLVQPRREQVQALGKKYYEHRVAAVTQVIQIFKRLHKTIYIVSAGLLPALKVFGELLQVAPQNIHGVHILFDVDGNYVSYDRETPFSHADGKMEVVSMLKMRHPEILYIGDGLNDLPVKDLVSRFVGFGGAYYRKNIADHCNFYLNAPTMAPLLPLGLTEMELANLTAEEDKIYKEGLRLIHEGKVLMK